MNVGSDWDAEMTMGRRFVILFTLILIVLTLLLSACGSDPAEYALAPESALPEFVRDAPQQVKEAYRFAIANPDILEVLPCYCGCRDVGHMNNLDCYIHDAGAGGQILFDNHAFG
jgi:hypothetical protein